MSKWNDVAYLQKVAGHRTVPVEVSSDYFLPRSHDLTIDLIDAKFWGGSHPMTEQDEFVSAIKVFRSMLSSLLK